MKNWNRLKLSDLSKRKDAIVSGPFGSNLKVSDYKEFGIPILRLQNVGKGYFINKDIKFINDTKAAELKYHSFRSGDLVLAKLGIPVGKTCIIPDDFPNGIIVADVVRIRPEKNIVNYKFLEYFLNTDDAVAQLTGNITGATRPRVNLSDVRNIEINLPPLPEQRRIVSILDEAFSAIARAKANAEQNLRNAKELFESYLEEVFEDGNWGFVKLSEMATEISDGDHMPPPKSVFGLPFITISDINKQTHKIDFSDTFKVPQKYYDELKPNKKPIIGDVLYTVTGSYGIPVLIEDDFKFCFQRHIGLIRPSNKLNCKLLYYWILSPQAFLQASETATGTAQKTVSLRSLRNFRFPNIPIKDQQSIVCQLDALRAETQKLEAIYQQKLIELEELKKSILQKAFTGELKTEKAVAL